MSDPCRANTLPPVAMTLADAFLTVMPRPAALVVDGTTIAAANAEWRSLTGVDGEGPTGGIPLADSLKGYSGVGALLAAIGVPSDSAGTITLSSPEREASPHKIVVAWRRFEMGEGQPKLAVLVVDGNDDVGRLTSIIADQSMRIDELLICQTMIEEKERRRVGRALHDGVSQTLAQLRHMISASMPTTLDAAEATKIIDSAIEVIQDQTFALSPPVLEDLGLLPALRWLTEHLASRFGCRVELADDGVDPRLTPVVRTVAFRAVRELATNAAKHAASEEIVVSCVTGASTCRIMVRDSGPGFDVSRVNASPQSFRRYGLISVEQQVHAVGGEFNLVSIAGEGTRATLVFPLELEGRPSEDAGCG
jgi:signal transduction histidine kinase